jgi:hypothetical protein
MQVFGDFGFAVEAPSQRIDVVNMRIEIEFPSAVGTWAAAGIQHYIALSQSQQRPVDLAAIALAIDGADFEADGGVPLSGGTNVGHMNHRNDSFGQGNLSWS